MRKTETEMGGFREGRFGGSAKEWRTRARDGERRRVADRAVKRNHRRKKKTKISTNGVGTSLTPHVMDKDENNN